MACSIWHILRFSVTSIIIIFIFFRKKNKKVTKEKKKESPPSSIKQNELFGEVAYTLADWYGLFLLQIIKGISLAKTPCILGSMLDYPSKAGIKVSTKRKTPTSVAHITVAIRYPRYGLFSCLYSIAQSLPDYRSM